MAWKHVQLITSCWWKKPGAARCADRHRWARGQGSSSPSFGTSRSTTVPGSETWLPDLSAGAHKNRGNGNGSRAWNLWDVIYEWHVFCVGSVPRKGLIAGDHSLCSFLSAKLMRQLGAEVMPCLVDECLAVWPGGLLWLGASEWLWFKLNLPEKKHDEFGYHCYFSRNSSNPFGLVRTLPTYTLCITKPYPFQDRLEGLHKTHSKTMRHLFKKRTGCCVLLFDFDKVKKKHAWRENRFWTTTPSESQGPPCQVGETVSTQTAPQRHRQWLNVNALELRLNFARQVWLFYSMPWINFSPTQPSTFWLLDIQMAISSRRIDSD